MCVSARIELRGREVRWVESMAELRALLGWRVPVLPGYRYVPMDRCCLCPVDWSKLQRLAGWHRMETPGDDDPWRVWLTDDPGRLRHGSPA
jgi:hypothetical protein